MEDKEVSRMKTFREVQTVQTWILICFIYMEPTGKSNWSVTLTCGKIQKRHGWKAPMEERKAVQILHQMFTLGHGRSIKKKAWSNYKFHLCLQCAQNACDWSLLCWATNLSRTSKNRACVWHISSFVDCNIIIVPRCSSAYQLVSLRVAIHIQHGNRYQMPQGNFIQEQPFRKHK